jgi:broad specificity polyphosphatase/5'/3'-nucleotidase SurE
MVRKNSLARDFITSATVGLWASAAEADERGRTRAVAVSMATASKRAAKGSFMGMTPAV